MEFTYSGGDNLRMFGVYIFRLRKSENVWSLYIQVEATWECLESVQSARENVRMFGVENIMTGCFGVQSYISRRFLIHLDMMFNLNALIPLITCRTDRCSLERIMAAMFHVGNPKLYYSKSLLGNISTHYKSFKYNFNEYDKDFKHQRIKNKIIKVWTGR